MSFEPILICGTHLCVVCGCSGTHACVSARTCVVCGVSRASVSSFGGQLYDDGFDRAPVLVEERPIQLHIAEPHGLQRTLFAQFVRENRSVIPGIAPRACTILNRHLLQLILILPREWSKSSPPMPSHMTDICSLPQTHFPHTHTPRVLQKRYHGTAYHFPAEGRRERRGRVHREEHASCNGWNGRVGLGKMARSCSERTSRTDNTRPGRAWLLLFPRPALSLPLSVCRSVSVSVSGCLSVCVCLSYSSGLVLSLG